MIIRKRESLNLVLITICALAGCDREPAVSQTSQPKDTSTATTPAVQAKPSDQPGMGMDQAAAQAGLTWSAPGAWHEDKTPRPMREATFTVGEGDKAAELAVTRLSGQFGDMASNINRWRGQVGLEAVADAATVPSRDVKSAAGDVKVYTMEGPAKSITVGMLKQGESTWFFKLVGDKTTVAQNVTAFDQFLQSLRTVNVTAGDK